MSRITEWFINNKPSENVYNVCTGQSYDYKTIAQKIVQICSKSLQIKPLLKGLGVEYSGDNSKLMNEISDFEFTSIDDGLRSMLSWFEQNKTSIKEELFEY